RCTECSGPDDSPKYAVSRTSETTTSSSNVARRRRTCLSYTGRGSPTGWKLLRGFGTSVAPAPAVARFLARSVDRLELLERPARADRDARERRLGQVGGHLRLVAEALVEALQQRAAARE